ncbi:vomeronasal type-2 receptor 116-like [Xenopus laevis]|uniref:Vomeronasal type-2 receptor 116-like n=1 Tax=Xenopus laevis TaxID=8355 RepID=A0A8J1KR16_XENLA|nr:vomeronasal type-2 receptor 116-like [Xenopus laevis]
MADDSTRNKKKGESAASSSATANPENKRKKDGPSANRISYGTMESLFDDKVQFPYFYRTVPNDQVQYRAIVQLLKHFRWNWVGLVTSFEDQGDRISVELEEYLLQNDICLQFKFTMSSVLLQGNAVDLNCEVIILYISSSSFSKLVFELSFNSTFGKVFILPASLQIHYQFFRNTFLNGSLMFRLHNRNIPGLKDFLLRDGPLEFSDNPFLDAIRKEQVFCLPESFEPDPFIRETLCNKTDTDNIMNPLIYDVENFRITYSIYTAVYAVAFALHDLYSHRSHHKEWKLHPWQIHRYLRNLHFSTPGGEDVTFDEKGNVAETYDILNIIQFPDKGVEHVLVGHVYPADGDTQLVINDSAITWESRFAQTPNSTCNPICPPGSRKVYLERQPKCCYGCAHCPEGEVSNGTDMVNCIKCLDDQWPNGGRNTCISKRMEFLSYEDPLGFSLATIAVSFSFITTITLGIFIKHKDTPIVKANNHILSFLLLLFLTFSSLCPLLFIGHPTQISCFLSYISFGTFFTVAISTLLAKTFIVTLAFRVVKPDRKVRGWLWRNMSMLVVLLCSCGEVLICITWLAYSPPFPEYNTKLEADKIILRCNEGSIIAFYVQIGYLGLLALFSFIVAFMARKLPDAFNEAQYITFSMLGFCSVWVSFIPANLSTKGKYMVAVECFAILASSLGIFGCIFVPKCYIILIRPERNIRASLIVKKQEQRIKT